MKAIVDVESDELVVTLQFFSIGGYVTEETYNTKVAELEERLKAVEDDLNSRVFG